MSNELWQVNNPNPFQLRIEREFGFSIWEQVYCTPETIKKVKKMDLPRRECSINNIAADCIDPLSERREYCIKNCGFKCKST